MTRPSVAVLALATLVATLACTNNGSWASPVAPSDSEELRLVSHPVTKSSAARSKSGVADAWNQNANVGGGGFGNDDNDDDDDDTVGRTMGLPQLNRPRRQNRRSNSDRERGSSLARRTGDYDGEPIREDPQADQRPRSLGNPLGRPSGNRNRYQDAKFPRGVPIRIVVPRGEQEPDQVIIYRKNGKHVYAIITESEEALVGDRKHAITVPATNVRVEKEGRRSAAMKKSPKEPEPESESEEVEENEDNLKPQRMGPCTETVPVLTITEIPCYYTGY
jgi:hypothetical protein